MVCCGILSTLRIPDTSISGASLYRTGLQSRKKMTQYMLFLWPAFRTDSLFSKSHLKIEYSDDTHWQFFRCMCIIHFWTFTIFYHSLLNTIHLKKYIVCRFLYWKGITVVTLHWPWMPYYKSVYILKIQCFK